MIPSQYIDEWKNVAPWAKEYQVEQDLILSRAIVEIYNNALLKETLLFRGGTALHKLFSKEQERYSEDLDFVQKDPHPIGEILRELHAVLDPWLSIPKYKQSHGRVTLYYKYTSESLPSQPMKVKIEINTREHHRLMDLVHIPFGIKSRWFTGNTLVTTYRLEELLATKLRALYQRKKGRDLFDLYVLLMQNKTIDPLKVAQGFQFYLENDGLSISKREFEKNMTLKLTDNLFLEDMLPLLHPKKPYNPMEAYKKIHEKFISHIK